MMTKEQGDTAKAAASKDNDTLLPVSQERLLDAEAIEQAAESIVRPTARMHLTALAKKLRKESEALQRVEQSRAKAEESKGESQKSGVSSPKVSVPVPAVTPPAPATAAAPPVASSSVKYTTIDRFAFDAGSFNSAFVTLYVSLPGVGDIPKKNVSCDFDISSFDLIVRDLNGRSYRLVKDNLEKDIDVEKSKFVVKADKVVIKLAKTKGEYGSYDHWTKLSDSKKKGKKSNSDNPSESIMGLMKDMYDSGDDRIRKAIGEAMLKTNQGQKPGKFDADMDDMGL